MTISITTEEAVALLVALADAKGGAKATADLASFKATYAAMRLSSARLAVELQDLHAAYVASTGLRWNLPGNILSEEMVVDAREIIREADNAKS